MAVRQEKWKSKKGRRSRKVWVVDFVGADGVRRQEKSPVQNKRGARSYELTRRREIEAEVLAESQVMQVIPIFGDFAAEFMRDEAPTTSGYSEMKSKRCLLDCHLLPRFGDFRLDEIKVRGIKQLIGHMQALPRAPKTINNALTLLKTILRYAVEVEVLETIPKIKLLTVPPQDFDFLDFDELLVLLDAVKRDLPLYVAVLLAVDAGLRAGEVAGVQWQDVNFQLGRLKVVRQLQDGRELPPKWGSVRVVPLTQRLTAALKAHRSLNGPWVLQTGKTVRGRTSLEPWSKETLRWRGVRIYRLASLPKPGKPWHCLRHTFCSHLAMRGVPARSIQELAGHKSLTTTMRYMHLTPQALENAISKLEEPAPWGPGSEGEKAKNPKIHAGKMQERRSQ